jgi:predicted Zn-dependent peptidase
LEFLRSTLENGLEIVAECNGQAHSTAIGFFVNTGARDESPELAGISHFLEHMAFKGTAQRSGDDVNREFDEMGAQYNACTGEEHTVFFASVLPEHQDRVLGLLADILRPALREEDFQTEKQVILEEIRMYEDQPPFGADEKCRNVHWRGHPLGQSVLGSMESVGKLTVEAMRAYLRARYVPGNIALVATGRVDFDALVRSAQRYCGDWEPSPASRIVQPPVHRRGFHHVRKESATLAYAVQMTAGPTATDGDRYAAKLLAAIVGDDTGSRLFWELIDPGLAESASMGHYEFEGAGLMVTYLGCDPSLATENLQRIHDLFRRVESESVAQAELDQARTKVSSRVVLSGERPRGRLFVVGDDWLHRRQYRSVRDDLDSLAAMTLDDVTNVVAKYPLSSGTTLIISPLNDIAPPR